MVTDSILVRLTKTAIVLTLCVIVLGAYTRLSDAGLGCPDWPGCYGQLTVPDSQEERLKAGELFPGQVIEQDKAWIEMIHRYFAGTLGLLVFAITFFAVRSSSQPKGLPLALSVLVIGQALLGMWTVTMKLMPLVVLAHLFGGFALLSLLVIMLSRLESVSLQMTEPISPAVRKLAVAALVVLVAQIFLGGWTSTNYAALMCTSLPICQGDWTEYLDFKTAFTLYQPGFDNYEYGVLDYAGRMTIHVSHRFGAIVSACVLLLFSWQLYRQGLVSQSRQLAVLLLVQFCLGLSNVVFHLPLPVAVLHNLGAALLLALLVRISYQLYLLPVKRQMPLRAEKEMKPEHKLEGGSHE